MKTTIIFSLFILGTLLTGQEYLRPVLYDTNGEVPLKGSRLGQIMTEQNFRFNIGEFVYRRVYRQQDGGLKFTTSSRLGFRAAGHAGSIVLSYPKAREWPPLEGYWLTTGEKNSTVAQLTAPVTIDGKRAGFYSFRLAQSPEHPEWLFIRLTLGDVFPGSLSWNFDGGWTEFDKKYQKNAAATRWLYSNGKACGGLSDTALEALSDKNFSFGLYAQNTAKFDQTATILIAHLPPGVKSVLRFRGQSQSLRLRLTGLQAGQELYFALGNLRQNNSRKTVEEFYRIDRIKQINGLLNSINWEPIFASTEIETLPPAEQQKLKELFAQKRYDEYYRTVKSGTRASEKSTMTELESMLD